MSLQSKKNAKVNQQESNKDKDNDENPNLCFAPMEGKCYVHRKGGHKSPQCCHRSRPMEEGVINKAKPEDASLSQFGNTTTIATISNKNTNDNTSH